MVDRSVKPEEEKDVSFIKDEFMRLVTELTEIDLLLGQTQNEVARLAAKRDAAASRVHEVDRSLENRTAAEVKEAYTAWIENSLRHLMMQGQFEALRGKKLVLERYQRTLEKLVSGFSPAVSESAAEPAGMEAAQIRSKIMQAQEEERKRIAREMHDGPAQSLSNLILRAEICEHLFDKDPQKAREELAGLKALVNATLQETRKFIFELRPMTLDDLGLVPTLRRYIQALVEKSKIAFDFDSTGTDRRLPPEIEAGIFRVIQGVLSNIIRHDGASKILVMLNWKKNELAVTIENDAKGLSPEEILAKAREIDTAGLASIQERLDVLGGKLRVESLPTGGTRILLNVPVPLQ